jgi:hypothetical protein
MTQHAPRPSARPGSLRTLTAALGRTRPRPLPSPRSLAFTARFSLPLPSHVVRWEPPAAPKPPARPTTALHVTCPSSVEREISGFGCGGGVWQGAACHGVQAAAIHGRSMLILTLCVLIPSLIPGPDAVLAVLARANTANTDLSMLGFPVLAVLAELSNTRANTLTSVAFAQRLLPAVSLSEPMHRLCREFRCASTRAATPAVTPAASLA